MTLTFMLLVKRGLKLVGKIEGKKDPICVPFAKIKPVELLLR